jgi:hypothetical protein
MPVPPQAAPAAAFPRCPPHRRQPRPPPSPDARPTAGSPGRRLPRMPAPPAKPDGAIRLAVSAECHPVVAADHGGPALPRSPCPRHLLAMPRTPPARSATRSISPHPPGADTRNRLTASATRSISPHPPGAGTRSRLARASLAPSPRTHPAPTPEAASPRASLAPRLSPPRRDWPVCASRPPVSTKAHEAAQKRGRNPIGLRPRSRVRRVRSCRRSGPRAAAAC